MTTNPPSSLVAGDGKKKWIFYRHYPGLVNNRMGEPQSDPGKEFFFVKSHPHIMFWVLLPIGIYLKVLSEKETLMFLGAMGIWRLGYKGVCKENCLEIPVICMRPLHLALCVSLHRRRPQKRKIAYSFFIRAAHLETQQKPGGELGFMHASIKVAMQPIVRILSATDGLLMLS